jgi:predicted phage-related endonuclease
MAHYEEIGTREDLGHDKWWDLRYTGITGTRAPKVLGHSRWGDPVSCFADYRARKPSEDPGERAYWGIRLEDVVLEEIARREPDIVKRVWSVPMVRSIEHPFMLANPDAAAEGRFGKVVLEAKTAGLFRKPDWDPDGRNTRDGVPMEYWVQGQHYLAVMGPEYEAVVFGCLVGGQEFITRTALRDEAFIREMIKTEAHFMQCLADDDPMPLVNDSESCAAAIEELHRPNPRLPVMSLEDDDEVRHLLLMLKAAKETEAEATRQIRESKNMLKAKMGSHVKAKFGDTTISWSEREATRFDKNAFARQEPEMYRQYEVKSAYRVFQVKGGLK